MSTEENKALMRRSGDALNQQNLAAYYELIAPDVVVHDHATTMQGLEALKQFVTMYFSAFPDAQYTIEDMRAEGDSVFARYTVQGTHQGNLMGLAPTGKQVSILSMVIVRYANGKAVEIWYNYDRLGMMQQMGAIPPME